MTFEMDTLDMATVADETDIEALGHAEVKEAVVSGLRAAGDALAVPAARVHARLAKVLGLKTLRRVDEHDLREAQRVLRSWTQERTAYTAAGRDPRPLIRRPSGIGELPLPRIWKLALADAECALCADPVKTGELIGRMRAPDHPYVAMGWLCRHCLLDRRAEPRRRDVLLRLFHAPFAGSAVSMNAHECALLRTWLAEDPRLRECAPWRADPLEGTLVRLHTSTTEGKAATWLDVVTARTITAVLQQAAATASTGPADAEVLAALAQHLDEWDTNPTRVPATKFGTGPRYRAEVLRTSPHPTLLSARGGPFDLNTAATSSERSGE